MHPTRSRRASKTKWLMDSNLILWPDSKVFTRLPVKRGILARIGKQCIREQENTAQWSGIFEGDIINFKRLRSQRHDVRTYTSIEQILVVSIYHFFQSFKGLHIDLFPGWLNHVHILGNQNN